MRPATEGLLGVGYWDGRTGGGEGNVRMSKACSHWIRQQGFGNNWGEDRDIGGVHVEERSLAVPVKRRFSQRPAGHAWRQLRTGHANGERPESSLLCPGHPTRKDHPSVNVRDKMRKAWRRAAAPPPRGTAVLAESGEQSMEAPATVAQRPRVVGRSRGDSR